MKFGIGLPTGMEGLIHPVPFFRPSDFLEMAALAEQLGYDSVWGNDHYTPPHYVRDQAKRPNLYEVLTVLAAISAATERVELGVAVLLVPMRDPSLLARQVATLDQLSGGRLLLGVGIGAYPEEYAAMRPDLSGRNRGKMLDEGIDLLGRLFVDSPVTFFGAHYRVDGFELNPKPVRQPFPLLIGGHKEAAMDRAVRYGQGWIPGWRPLSEMRAWIKTFREKAAASNRDPGSMIVAPQLSCLIAPTDHEAKERYSRSGMVRHRQSLAYTGRDPNSALEGNLIGSADTVLERVQYLHDAGADHLACLTFCVSTVDEFREQLYLFAEGVLRPYRRSRGC